MKTAFPYRYILALPTFEYGCLVAKYQGGDKAEARGTDKEPLSVEPLLTRYGETYSVWQY